MMNKLGQPKGSLMRWLSVAFRILLPLTAFCNSSAFEASYPSPGQKSAPLRSAHPPEAVGRQEFVALAGDYSASLVAFYDRHGVTEEQPPRLSIRPSDVCVSAGTSTVNKTL